MHFRGHKKKKVVCGSSVTICHMSVWHPCHLYLVTIRGTACIAWIPLYLGFMLLTTAHLKYWGLICMQLLHVPSPEVSKKKNVPQWSYCTWFMHSKWIAYSTMSDVGHVMWHFKRDQKRRHMSYVSHIMWHMQLYWMKQLNAVHTCAFSRIVCLYCVMCDLVQEEYTDMLDNGVNGGRGQKCFPHKPTTGNPQKEVTVLSM